MLISAKRQSLGRDSALQAQTGATGWSSQPTASVLFLRYFVLWPESRSLMADGQRFVVDAYGSGGLLLASEVSVDAKAAFCPPCIAPPYPYTRSQQ